jgi:histidine triad (HIT) family protein
MDCMFCGFVSGEQAKHLNGFDFIAIYESEHSLVFLSTDTSVKEKAHSLVIPKKHYKYLEEIQKPVLDDMIQQVAKITTILREKHEGCNVLLNDGRVAGQFVMHTHFHVIARNKGDDIKINTCEEVNISNEEFVELSKFLAEKFNS